MALLSSVKAAFHRPSTEEKHSAPAVVDAHSERTDKDGVANDAAAVNDGRDGGSESDHPADNLQRGVQEVEAVTMTWSKATLIGVFCKYVH